MDESFWVFGYGSLMWNPGFAHRSRSKATLHGAHRALCVFSHVYRGTPERPGLVFGLEAGGSCAGVAFEVAQADREEVRDYLRAREQVTLVYVEAFRKVRLEDGRQVSALTYLVDRHHPQYAGRLDLERRLALVRQGVGKSGPNPDYVLSTLAHLQEIGVRDRALEAIARQL